MRQLTTFEVAYQDRTRRIRAAFLIRVMDKKTARAIGDSIVRQMPGSWHCMGVN